MEPIFDLPPDVPPHTEVPSAPVKAEVLREWPVGTFVENLAVLTDDSIALAVHTSNAVEVVHNGSLLRSINLPVPTTGLVARQNGGFYIAGGEPGKSPGRVWQVEPDGRAELVVEVADALFLNGLTPLTEDILLAAESLLGRIYKFDLRSKKSEVWFEDQALSKITTFPFLPGANGIKVYDSYVYVTNTDRATVIRIKVEADGTAGAWQLVAESLRGDDFAFDEEGSIYFATHIENSIVRLSANGDRIAVAGSKEGMAGSTSVAFGRDIKDRTHAYVTTTGGLLRPYQRIVQPAKLIRLELPVAGAQIPLAI